MKGQLLVSAFIWLVVGQIMRFGRFY